MGLKDIEARLLPGFRFHPTDEELVCHYLSKKAIESTTGYKDEADALKNMGMSLVEVDLHTIEPWQLPEVAKLNETEWYFFSFRDRKYATGLRTNRATTIGYWKATGKDRVIQNPSTRSVVGMRKTLVFYKNRAPNGIKTGWIMHEFRLDTPHLPPKEDWVLCRVSHRIKISSALHNCFSNLGCCQPSGVTNYRINNNYGDYNSNVICKLRAEEERNTVIAGSSVAEMNSVDNGGGGWRGDYDFLWVMNIEETNSLAPSNEQDTIWMETI